jgi:hypothetical protein
VSGGEFAGEGFYQPNSSRQQQTTAISSSGAASVATASLDGCVQQAVYFDENCQHSFPGQTLLWVLGTWHCASLLLVRWASPMPSVHAWMCCFSKLELGQLTSCRCEGRASSGQVLTGVCCAAQVNPPTVYPASPLQMLCANIDYDEHKGRIAIGRVVAGTVKKGQQVSLCSSLEPGVVRKGKVNDLYVYDNFSRCAQGGSRRCHPYTRACWGY